MPRTLGNFNQGLGFRQFDLELVFFNVWAAQCSGLRNFEVYYSGLRRKAARILNPKTLFQTREKSCHVGRGSRFVKAVRQNRLMSKLTVIVDLNASRQHTPFRRGF